MKKIYNNFTVVILMTVFTFLFFKNAGAGNEDRSGQAGATELLINPWGRSSGWGLSNSASIKGIESTYLNIAGLAFTPKTEVIFARTQWLKGSGININAFGFSQHVGESGVLGISLMTMSFGEIEITQVDQPEGGIGKFSPTLTIGIAYSKAFSSSIFGGFNLKIINEAISNAKATGVALDAGIQYVTGEQEQIKFGVSMKNVGTKLRFGGDGLDIRGFLNPNDPNSQITVTQKSADYEMPSLINIGASYDFLIHSSVDTTLVNHRITLAANFTSNSFTKDQYSIGLEYSLKNILMLRGGYVFEKDILDNLVSTNAYNGPCAGLTVELPLNKEKSTTLGIDYSYRTTNPFLGTHTFGVRINL
jgi:hypothetical protein